MGLSVSDRSFLKLISLTTTDTVAAAGGVDTIRLQPPVGQMYKIRDIYYQAPAPVGDTSGTHSLYIKTQDGVMDMAPAYIAGNHSTAVEIRNFGFAADISEMPNDSTDQLDLMHDGILLATNDVYIEFMYTNSTDADQTGSRVLKILVEVVPAVV